MQPTTQFQPKNQARGSSNSSFAVVWIADVPSWAAHRTDPTLEGQTLVITAGRRVVGSDASARSFKVRVGDSLERARGLAPNAVFVPFEASVVQTAWDAALHTMNAFTPWLESGQVGLAFLAGLNRLEVEALALELQARVGLAPSRGSALMAAFSARDSEVRLVQHEAEFLGAAPTYLLRGAGLPGEIIERLRLFGLHTLGSIAALEARYLQAQFGAFAPRLLALCTGLDRRSVPVFTPALEVSAGFEFELPAIEPNVLYPALDFVLERLVLRLQDRLASSVTLALKTTLGVSSVRRSLKAPSNDPRTLRHVALAALERAMTGLEVLALTVTASGLMRPVLVQDSLFAVLERPAVREVVRRIYQGFPERLGRLEIVQPRSLLPERRFRFRALTGEEVGQPKRKGRRK